MATSTCSSRQNCAGRKQLKATRVARKFNDEEIFALAREFSSNYHWSVSRCALLILACVALAACADIPPNCIVDGQPKSVTPAEVESLFAAARKWLHSGGLSIPPVGVIYR